MGLWHISTPRSQLHPTAAKKNKQTWDIPLCGLEECVSTSEAIFLKEHKVFSRFFVYIEQIFQTWAAFSAFGEGDHETLTP